MVDPESIMQFWFADSCDSPQICSERGAIWFGGDKQLDEQIFEHYADGIEDAALGRYDYWSDTATGRLALILMLDQFPRNLYRGTAEAFRYDSHALTLAEQGVKLGQLAGLAIPQQAFLLMPYQHSESLGVQDNGIELYSALAEGAEPDWHDLACGYRDFAVQHRDIIAEFGRFPHRNAALGRSPTDAESLYLAEGGATFGQASHG